MQPGAAVQAAAGAQSVSRQSPQQQHPQATTQPLPLVLGFRYRWAGEVVQQSLVALARGLLLELLPLPLGTPAQLEQQRRRLAAVAGAVCGGLVDGTLSSEALQQRLAAALTV